ncbi:unnamed protein product, partial [Meganyctiphanes norvegica]
MNKEQIDTILASLTSRDERLQELSEALKGRDAIIDKQQDTMEKLVQRVETLTNAAAKVKQNDIQNASSINNDYAKKNSSIIMITKTANLKESRLHVIIVDNSCGPRDAAQLTAHVTDVDDVTDAAQLTAHKVDFTGAYKQVVAGIDKLIQGMDGKAPVPDKDGHHRRSPQRHGDYVTYRGEDGDWQRHSIRRHSLQVEPCDYTFKIMLIGDSCVGKTCLMTRFKDGTFLSGTFISTVGMDFRNKVVTVDGSKVKLQIWDTAGQERFRSVTHAYYRDAHALLLLYDVTNKGSFDNTRAWLAEVHEYAQDDVVIMLIGNKGDVPERVLRREDGERLAREYNVAFMETSAKTGTNVDLAFMAVARELKARKSSNPDERKFNVAEYVRQEARTESCLCNIG